MGRASADTLLNQAGFQVHRAFNPKAGVRESAGMGGRLRLSSLLQTSTSSLSNIVIAVLHTPIPVYYVGNYRDGRLSLAWVGGSHLKEDRFARVLCDFGIGV